MAVRQHLYTMQEEGLVSFEEKAEGRGRPTKYWSLTDAANAYFPDAHGDLAVSLLTEMREVFGEEGLERLLAARTEDQKKSYKKRLRGTESLEAKLTILAEIRSEEGYMASSMAAPDEEGAFLLVENHCPVCSAAATCQGLCKYELELFQSVVGRGAEVTREEHILSGARRCAYRIGLRAVRVSEPASGWLLVEVPQLHFAENPFTLHLLFQRLESLIDVVVANEYLHELSLPFPSWGVADTVSDPTAPEILDLVRDMIETMEDANGAGLAAPQVYVPQRVVIFQAPGARATAEIDAEEEFDPTAPLTVLINPEIETVGDELELGWEGCLSVPGLRGLVPRHRRIIYRGVDLDGQPIERRAQGFHARVVQHECDHLDGILYPQRMPDMRALIFESEIKHWLEETSEKVLKAALPDVPFDGWTGAVLLRAAKAADVDHGLARLAFPNGARDLAEYFLADGDRRMIDVLAKTDLGSMKIREKITFAVRTRLEVDENNREALRRASTSLLIPPASGSAATSLYNTVDAIWVAIGDTSTDYNFYTKRATLAGVFTTTLACWFADESEGHADTWAFLDRRIADVMQIEKIKAQATKVMDSLPDPLGLLARLRYPASN
eukprot:s1_g92.t1